MGNLIVKYWFFFFNALWAKNSPYTFAGCHLVTTDHSFIPFIPSTECGEVEGNSEVSYKRARE